jgi:branched-chain amino acid transport system substrate-binding protein
MSAAGLIMISGNNSAPFLTSVAGKKAPDWQEGYFRTAGNEENAGAVAAAFAFIKQGLTKAAVINDNDIYTRGLTESFKKAFVELGGTVVLDTAVDKGDAEMLPVLAAVRNTDAEVLFFPLFQPEGNQLLIQARKMPFFKDVLMISGGALIEESFLESVGDAGKGMCFVGPSVPTGSAVQELTRAYIEKYKEKPSVSYFLSGFDAAELLFHVIEKTAVQDSKGHLHIGRQQLRKAMYAIQEYNGINGELSCDKFGDCAASSFKVLQLDDPAAGLEGLENNIVYPDNSSR